MNEENTPTDPMPVLRQAPELVSAIDGEATPVVTMEQEDTPYVPTAGLEGGLKLPRSGIDEVDQALGDLERAVRRMLPQERRIIVVVAGVFVSLFVPWFRLEHHGPDQPTSLMAGLEVVSWLAFVCIGAIVFILLARDLSMQRLGVYRGLAIKISSLILAWALFDGLWSSPSPIPWSYSLWAAAPALLLVALILGVLGQLPTWRRR